MSEKKGFAALLDLEHPFFLPPWRRVLTSAFCLGWALIELSSGNMFWAILFGAAGIYATYCFFFAWDEEAVAKKLEDSE